MNLYWDSSALVACASELPLRDRLKGSNSWTRPHALAEVFSTLTGGRLGFRVDPDDASSLIAGLAEDLKFVELTSKDTLDALAMARGRGIRGGRVHDFLHAIAARKAECTHVLTLNVADFVGVDPILVIESP